MQRKYIITSVLAISVFALLVYALLPTPIPVSTHVVTQGYFAEYVEEEGRTRLRDSYTVSTPISGWLRRVELEAGDSVSEGDVLFQLEALPAPALDARAREQARETMSAARSRLESAEAQLELVRTQLKLAESELVRAESLHQQRLIPEDSYDRTRSQRDAARTAVNAAEHSVDVARFEMESAKAVLEVADGKRSADDQPSLDVPAPISGTIMQRFRCCEGAVNAGEPILEIGSLDALEIQVDMLSMDAVRVREGMRVLIERWGGDKVLEGQVRRVEPAGFMRVSALGVEEQRVPVLVEILSPRDTWSSLGVGFRVETRFILWESDAVLQLPTSALFRSNDHWSVFVVEDERAALREVVPGRRSGLYTAVNDGLQQGEQVITHPGDRIRHGSHVIAEPDEMR